MPAAAVLAPTATRTCTNAACINALTHVELCECGDCLGDNHGSAHKAGRAQAVDNLTARYVTRGFTAAMLVPAGSDDAF